MNSRATIVARTIASIPKRSATETWDCIVDLIAPDKDSAARRDLSAVAGIVCSCITDETLANDALVVLGTGPRLRVYCVYEDAAIEGDGINEGGLSFVPTDGDWRMSVPCLSDDLAWVQKNLARVSTRVTARALGEEVAEMAADQKAVTESQSRAPVVNLDEFLRG